MICNDILTGKSGIYRITNLINGKIYIGRSVNLKDRKSKHKTKISNTIISKAIQKYGHDNFLFEVIEYCELDKLVEREGYYFDLLQPFRENNGYNILRDSGENGWIGMSHSIVSRLKMSESKKGSIPWNKGKKGVQECSDETRRLMSENRKGESNSFYGKKHSEETIRHLRDLAKQRDMSHCNKKVIQIDKITGEIIKIWDSISDASEQVIGDRKSSRITAACKGKYKSAGGFKWLYFTQE